MKPTLELIHNFLKQLHEHSSWNELPSADRLEMIAIGMKIFPGSHYQGLAYRVISDASVPDLVHNFSSQVAGELASSWSHTLEGCSHFLADIVIGDGIEYFEGLLVEAHINGFSIHTWLTQYEELKVSHPHYPEVPLWVQDRSEEIILLEVKEIGSTKKFTFDAARDPNLIIE